MPTSSSKFLSSALSLGASAGPFHSEVVAAAVGVKDTPQSLSRESSFNDSVDLVSCAARVAPLHSSLRLPQISHLPNIWTSSTARRSRLPLQRPLPLPPPLTKISIPPHFLEQNPAQEIGRKRACSGTPVSPTNSHRITAAISNCALAANHRRNCPRL